MHRIECINIRNNSKEILARIRVDLILDRPGDDVFKLAQKLSNCNDLKELWNEGLCINGKNRMEMQKNRFHTILALCEEAIRRGYDEKYMREIYHKAEFALKVWDDFKRSKTLPEQKPPQFCVLTKPCSLFSNRIKLCPIAEEPQESNKNQDAKPNNVSLSVVTKPANGSDSGSGSGPGLPSPIISPIH